MKSRLMPSKLAIAVVAAATACLLIALLTGTSIGVASGIAVGFMIALVLAAAIDCLATRRAWLAAEPTLRRRLPPALAIGVQRTVELALEVQGTRTWITRLHDHMDSSLLVEGQPLDLTLSGGTTVAATYSVMPTRRGEVVFAPADIRICSRYGLLELLMRIGERETRRIYPDFAQVARYAWLAGDRRLSEIGIKTYHQRGEGTDFKQLSEYRFGDPVRHLDWRATLRLEKPIVRQFQNERDQCVLLLIDCGRHGPFRPGTECGDVVVVRGAEARRCGRSTDLRHTRRRGALVCAPQGCHHPQRLDG